MFCIDGTNTINISLSFTATYGGHQSTNRTELPQQSLRHEFSLEGFSYKQNRVLNYFTICFGANTWNTPHGFPRSIGPEHSVAGTKMAKAAIATNITKIFTIIITRS
jgi:hypothetical protein